MDFFGQTKSEQKLHNKKENGKDVMGVTFMNCMFVIFCSKSIDFLIQGKIILYSLGA